MTTLEVDARDVLRIIEQYCKEAGLVETLETLQRESGVSLDLVNDANSFIEDISRGKWDSVLKQAQNLSLPKAKLFDLYEQVVLEMLELRELDTARAILRKTDVFAAFRREEAARVLRLERLLARGTFDSLEAYPGGTSKESCRMALAESLGAEVRTAPPARLLALLTQAMKWQQYQGRLPPGSQLDLVHGAAPSHRAEQEKPPRRQAGAVRFGAQSHAECCIFAPDGQSMVTGTVDGFVEVWNYDTCKLRKDLKYQADDDIMMHDVAVLCLAFSRDCELLASGCKDGKIKVWRLSSGKCLRRFDRAHAQGITSVCFSRDGSQLLSGSYDQMVRVHGLKSGRMLKEYRGHTSFVNAVLYLPLPSAGGVVCPVSGSSDATLRIWDSKSTECRSALRLPKEQAGDEVAITQVIAMPRSVEQLLVCSRCAAVHLINIRGAVLRTFGSPGSGPIVLAIAFSMTGRYVFAAGEDGKCTAFETSSGEAKHTLEFGGEILGLASHPHRNLLAAFARGAPLSLWKP